MSQNLERILLGHFCRLKEVRHVKRGVKLPVRDPTRYDALSDLNSISVLGNTLATKSLSSASSIRKLTDNCSGDRHDETTMAETTTAKIPDQTRTKKTRDQDIKVYINPYVVSVLDSTLVLLFHSDKPSHHARALKALGDCGFSQSTYAALQAVRLSSQESRLSPREMRLYSTGEALTRGENSNTMDGESTADNSEKNCCKTPRMVYDAAMSSLAKNRDPDPTERVFAELVKDSIKEHGTKEHGTDSPIPLSSWNILLHAYSLVGRWQCALELLEKLSASGKVNPNAQMYTSVMLACERGGQNEKSREIYEKYILRMNMEGDVENHEAGNGIGDQNEASDIQNTNESDNENGDVDTNKSNIDKDLHFRSDSKDFKNPQFSSAAIPASDQTLEDSEFQVGTDLVALGCRLNSLSKSGKHEEAVRIVRRIVEMIKPGFKPERMGHSTSSINLLSGENSVRNDVFTDRNETLGFEKDGKNIRNEIRNASHSKKFSKRFPTDVVFYTTLLTVTRRAGDWELSLGIMEVMRSNFVDYFKMKNRGRKAKTGLSSCFFQAISVCEENGQFLKAEDLTEEMLGLRLITVNPKKKALYAESYVNENMSNMQRVMSVEQVDILASLAASDDLDFRSGRADLSNRRRIRKGFDLEEAIELREADIGFDLGLREDSRQDDRGNGANLRFNQRGERIGGPFSNPSTYFVDLHDLPTPVARAVTRVVIREESDSGLDLELIVGKGLHSKTVLNKEGLNGKNPVRWAVEHMLSREIGLAFDEVPGNCGRIRIPALAFEERRKQALKKRFANST